MSSPGDGVLRVHPLGGLGEVGKNCLALVQNGEAMLVDCGVTFDDRGLGADVIHPDFAPLDALDARLVGVAITHGHEDHIGALPYLLERHDVPVWAPPYALGLVRERLREHEILEWAELHETRPGRAFRIGSFELEPIRVTHSIADATALAIRTVAGTVVHTGDFKIDPAPADGEHFDEARFRALGDEGVRLLFSDSTNVDAEGPTGSERGVGDALEPLVEGAAGAVFVSLFASNVHRLRMLGDIARRHGRTLVLVGRSVEQHAKVAHGAGYLGWPTGLVRDPARAFRELPRRKILALVTGSQGERRAALARIASRQHPTAALEAGDRVVLSARAIPGNERKVSGLVDAMLRAGAEVVWKPLNRAIHVSGHAHRPEQRAMLELVRPRTFVPVHGTLHHLRRHAELAREALGCETFVIENGQALAVDASAVRATQGAGAGQVFRQAGRHVPDATLGERVELADGGVVAVAVSKAGVTCTAHGLGAPEDRPRFVRGLREEAERTRAAHVHADPETLRAALVRAVRRAAERQTGARPVVLVTLPGDGA